MKKIFGSTFVLIGHLFFGVGILTACSTPTPYQHSDSDGRGYREQKIQDPLYRVSFSGNESTSRDTVELYLLYRAAELTLENNFNFFVFSEKDTEADVRLNSTGSGVYGGSGFGLGRRGFGGLGVGFGQSYNTNKKYEAMAYVNMYKDAPTGGPSTVFNAQEIKKNLEPQIKRPKKK